MSVLGRAKRLDDVVLGSSDSTRGFVVNLMTGLHPGLVPIWLGVAALCVVAAIIALATGDAGRAGTAVLAAAACGVMSYVSHGLPARPNR